MPQIELMIAGAQKAATTSLKNYLGQHPALLSHELTEFAFFANDEEYAAGFRQALKKYFPHLDFRDHRKLIAKNAGLYANESALQSLYEHNPECILVLILRNPVDRAYSSYNMEWESGWYTTPWADISKSLSNFKKGEKDQMFRLFIELGLYADHLKKIYRIFPQQQVEVVLFDDLKADPLQVCKRLFKKLRVDDAINIETAVVHNPTKKVRSKEMGKFLIWLMNKDNPFKIVAKNILPTSLFLKIRDRLFKANTADAVAALPEMESSIRQELITFFKPFNKQLETMTGLQLESWNH